MIKSIIGKTILFAFILAYVIGFKTVFGEENILIAVMSITGLLMFMGRDLTGEPIKNLFGLILFYVMIGVGTFIATHNLWIAIPVNFIIIFITSYTFGHVLKGPMYIPFSLLYLFLLATPVSIHQMPLRILALVVGAISIMLPQFLINKNKIEKASTKIFAGLIKLLIQKIDLANANNENLEIDNQILQMMKSLKDIIYDKKEKKFYITKEGQKSLDILVSLEKLNYLVDKHKNGDKLDFLNEIKSVLLLLEKLVTKEKSAKDVVLYVNEIIEKYEDTTDLEEIQGITSLKILALNIENLENAEYKRTRERDLKNDIYGLKNIKFNSIKTTYAIRVALAVTIACFIMEFFHLEQGRWIMYTVLSLTSPIFEVTKSKAKDRIIATLIGAIFIGITFSIFHSSTIRGLIIIGAGYANMYCETYRQKITTVTISAIGAAALIGGHVIGNHIIKATPLVLSMERAILILIGAAIAIIINMFLFRFDTQKANDHLENISDSLVEDLVKNIDKVLEGKNVLDYLNNIYLLNSQIDSTIQNNLKNLEKGNLSDKYSKFRELKNKVISDVYEFEVLVMSEKLKDSDKLKLKTLIDEVQNFKYINIEELKEKIQQSIKVESIENKLRFNLLFEIKKDIENMKLCY